MDLINVVMDMGLPTSLANSDAYLSNLEVLYDYVVEDPHVGNDYKTQLSIGLSIHSLLIRTITRHLSSMDLMQSISQLITWLYMRALKS